MPSAAPPARPERLWSKDFVLVALTNLFAALVFYLLVTALALYAVDRFGASDAEAGLAVSSFVLGAVVSRLFTGQTMDLIGRRRVLVVSLVVFLVASALYLVAGSLGLLITVRFVHGMAFGAASTTLAASVMGLIPRARRSEGTGWFGSSTSVGTALGPLLAFQLTDAFGYDALFIASTVFAGFALLMGCLARLPQPPRPGTRPRFSFRGLLSAEALPVSLVILLAGLSWASVLAFINGYSQQEDLDPSVTSMYFLVYSAVLLLSRLVVGPAQDRYGDNAVVVPLLACFAGSLAVLGLWPTPAGFLVSASLAALGFGALLTCLQAVAVTVVPEMRIGVATSTYFLMLDVGTGLGPVVLGALLPATGYSGMYLVLSGLMVVTIGVYWLVHGRRPGAGLRTRAG